MIITLFFLGATLVIASVLLILDTQQSRRVNKVLRDTKNVQPLFLIRTAEQKLNMLNALLYGYSSNIIPNGSKLATVNDDSRQLLSAQLSVVIGEYKNGEISLQAYNSKLNELVKMSKKIKRIPPVHSK
jgi:hypothetical protein